LNCASFLNNKSKFHTLIFLMKYIFYRHCSSFYRHCGLDPQSLITIFLYLQGIAGQAHNDDKKTQ